jgi:hypothetical protein
VSEIDLHDSTKINLISIMLERKKLQKILNNIIQLIRNGEQHKMKLDDKLD